ncbi:hypothetical protein ACFL0Y_04335 [Patescibacteria group bacterium]
MISFLSGWIGGINPPPGVDAYPTSGGSVPGLIIFLNNLLKLAIVGAGLFALFNIVLAGYGFLSAGDDPKKMAGASAKIWQSVVGLLIVASAFILAAIVGILLFNSPGAILRPQIYGPN